MLQTHTQAPKDKVPLDIYIREKMILKLANHNIQTYDLGGIPVWKASEESKGFQPHRDQ